jgi:putative FmdB family regulatory protein
MPTYEYECTSCNYKFEQFQSIKDKPLKKCPKCSGKLKRLVGSGAGIIFKGSGFYQTDYRSPSYKEAEKKEKTAGTTEPKTDSKQKADGKNSTDKKQ